jgi:hypothetical protein
MSQKAIFAVGAAIVLATCFMAADASAAAGHRRHVVRHPVPTACGKKPVPGLASQKCNPLVGPYTGLKYVGNV